MSRLSLMSLMPRLLEKSTFPTQEDAVIPMSHGLSIKHLSAAIFFSAGAKPTLPEHVHQLGSVALRKAIVLLRSPAVFKQTSRHVGYPIDAISNKRYSGVRALVCSRSIKLSAPGRNDARAWCVCGAFLDLLLDHPVLPLLENASSIYKRPAGGSWEIDETYIKIRGV